MVKEMTNKTEVTPKYFILDNDESYRQVIGTKCSREFCERYGCQFPDCAELGSEFFNKRQELKAAHPDAEIAAKAREIKQEQDNES